METGSRNPPRISFRGRHPNEDSTQHGELISNRQSRFAMLDDDSNSSNSQLVPVVNVHDGAIISVSCSLHRDAKDFVATQRQ